MTMTMTMTMTKTKRRYILDRRATLPFSRKLSTTLPTVLFIRGIQIRFGKSTMTMTMTIQEQKDENHRASAQAVAVLWPSPASLNQTSPIPFHSIRAKTLHLTQTNMAYIPRLC